jgi:hypothetical protein
MSLIMMIGIILYLNSLTVAVSAEALEAKGHYGKAKIRQRSSLMDTFSLSFVGNFDFSQVQIFKNFFSPTLRRNKLECLSLASFNSLA